MCLRLQARKTKSEEVKRSSRKHSAACADHRHGAEGLSQTADEIVDYDKVGFQPA